ncbi:unnamed protein product [Timema podura]|uniref:Uncharacterized protein n=1 Tax=Timema podura TaxID=61482 RepID=A0ABN7NV79_TIMPD|nr:unnamed protein product [Timema podura]
MESPPEKASSSIVLAFKRHVSTLWASSMETHLRQCLSVSSNRVMEITESLSHVVTQRAYEEGVLSPSNLLRGLFTARESHKTAAVLYSLFCDAFSEESSDKTFEEWNEEKSSQGPTFKFWFLILNLQILLLSFVRSIREKRLFSVSGNGDLDLDEFFAYENTSAPPYFSSNGALWVCQKSQIIKLLEDETNEPQFHGTFDTLIYDGAALVHALPPQTSRTFADYCCKEFKKQVFKQYRTDVEEDIE